MLRNLQSVFRDCLVASIDDAWHGSHENLPQIVGYSDGKAQTPFILLASGTYYSFYVLQTGWFSGL